MKRSTLLRLAYFLVSMLLWVAALVTFVTLHPWASYFVGAAIGWSGFELFNVIAANLTGRNASRKMIP
ncbi:hypothetical protein IP88_14785 [alpha proteobacterium AAP81b]|nr:hypothetical protein IP88_14785 [alpha proteobacterium AAP81b]